MGADAMGGSGFEALEILVLAVLAGFIIYKLRSVLGRRTGHEPPSGGTDTRYYRTGKNDNAETSRGQSGSDNVVPLPGTAQANASGSDDMEVSKYAPEGSPVAQGLMDIQLADRSFSPETFISGAEGAYEMIVTAFAEGDRKTLKQLIDPVVFEAFEENLNEREARNETVEFKFVGMKSSKITEAVLDGRMAQITVKFVSEVSSVTKNADGAVISGDPTAIRQVTDDWTFQRDIRNSDPNWVLIETSG